MDTDMVRVPPAKGDSIWSARSAWELVLVVDRRTHARYATVREGSLLKCSDSMKRSSRFQLMEAVARGGGCCGVVKWAWTYACGMLVATLLWRCDECPLESWLFPPTRVRSCVLTITFLAV
jgi:hypothetical protein